MSEPEDLIAEAALVASRALRAHWVKRAGNATSAAPALADLKRRLELFVAALFPTAPEIVPAEPPAPVSWLARLAGRAQPTQARGRVLASTDGVRVHLPRELDGMAPIAIGDRYRLLALEQAARAARGTPATTPVSDMLLRDLFLLAEAAVVDRLLTGMLPGIAGLIREARAEALQQRAGPRRASPRECAVEELVRAVLAADPARPPALLGSLVTPADSLAWAHAEHGRLAGLIGPYRGVAPVELWGTTATAPERLGTRHADADGCAVPPPGRTRTLPRRPRVREPDEGEDDSSLGPWLVRADDPQEKVEDPAGLQRPADRDTEADPGALADDLSELPEARLVRTAGAAHEVLTSDDPLPRAPAGEEARSGTGIAYPEWDWRAGVYHVRGAIVRERPATTDDGDWAERVLRRQAALVRGVRRDFERLRPRRIVRTRQPEGADVDIDAYVAAYADIRARGFVGDRFYLDARPERPDLGIALLVDASASTDGWVQGDRRIIDVEKEALLIVCEALAALGDPHAVLAFSGRGPARVEVRPLKRFREVAGAEVRHRIAALEPDGYTRMGAAIRHATRELARERTVRRLLLVLTDGRPNDVDVYEGRYGVEDARVAVVEARLQGIACFCLTVDRDAPRYAPRIFGHGHYVALGRPERLPAALPVLLRRLVRG